MKFQIPNFKFRTAGASAGRRARALIRRSPFAVRNFPAFSLVEILVVVALMSLIVLALMAVFNSTQRAFRAAVTQSDVLEGSRAAMDLITSDLRGLTPSGGGSNFVSAPVNCFVLANSSSIYTPPSLLATSYNPLIQGLPGGTLPRTNLLNYFFILGRQNTRWTGTGYIVDNTSTSPLYPLYRFYAETNIANSPATLYNLFAYEIYNAQWTNLSHLIDGVVHLTVRAYDPNGNWMNELINGYYQPYTNALNTAFLYPTTTPPSGYGYGEAQIYMFGGTVPASVELELGVMEDRTLGRAESLGISGQPPSPSATPAQWNYLTNQVGTVHLFRQRVTIPNVDPTAYQ